MNMERMEDNLKFGLDKASEIRNPTGEFDVVRLSMINEHDVPDTMNIGFKYIRPEETLNGSAYVQMMVYADGFKEPRTEPFEKTARYMRVTAPNSYSNMESGLAEEIYDYIKYCSNNYNGVEWPINVVEVVPMSELEFYEDVVHVVGSSVTVEQIEAIFKSPSASAILKSGEEEEKAGVSMDDLKAWMDGMRDSSIKHAFNICNALSKEFGYTLKKVTHWDHDGMPYHSWCMDFWFMENEVPFVWRFEYSSGWYHFKILKITADQFKTCTTTDAKVYSPGHSYSYFSAVDPTVSIARLKSNGTSKKAQLARYNETVVWADKCMRKIFGTWKISLDDE